ncbi:hypothetical protein L7F22_004823 [Adiantum nelumboides]|nr:hypothetical protein [Adiantum nelumboides]
MSNPGKKHWEAVKGTMRYFKHTKSMRICYGSQDLSVRGYTDSDYAGDLDKRRSTSGYVFTLAGGAISWRFQLQDCITQFTTEAEYIAANEACKEAVWLEVPYHGDLDYKIVLRSLPWKLSILRQRKHAKKLFGLVDW